ncbi:MAG: hypothetical protein V3R86_07025 [Candidatus Hydrothermarchaeaceae archaeon]
MPISPGGIKRTGIGAGEGVVSGGADGASVPGASSAEKTISLKPAKNNIPVIKISVMFL